MMATQPMGAQTSPITNRCWRKVAEMAQALAQQADLSHVPSPCQSVCVMHADTGWCEGCLRSIDEIAAWARLDNPTKCAVWQQLPNRLTQRMALEQGT